MNNHSFPCLPTDIPVLCLFKGVAVPLLLLLLSALFNELDLEGLGLELGLADAQKVYRDNGSAQESSIAQAEWIDDEEEERAESAVWTERLRSGLMVGQIAVLEEERLEVGMD